MVEGTAKNENDVMMLIQCTNTLNASLRENPVVEAKTGYTFAFAVYLNL